MIDRATQSLLASFKDCLKPITNSARVSALSRFAIKLDGDRKTENITDQTFWGEDMSAVLEVCDNTRLIDDNASQLLSLVCEAILNSRKYKR